MWDLTLLSFLEGGSDLREEEGKEKRNSFRRSPKEIRSSSATALQKENPWQEEKAENHPPREPQEKRQESKKTKYPEKNPERKKK